MADFEIIREIADGFTHQGHSVTYTDAYIKVRRSFLNEALRTLKGAPLSVFFAVCLSADPPDAITICGLTGYHDVSVGKALDYLTSRHYLEELKRVGPRGNKLYRPIRYAWSGSDKNAPPESQSTKIEDRRESFARHDDDDVKHNHSKMDESFIMTTRKTFSEHGIQGKNLDLLAQSVTPSVAQKWAEWLENVDREKWTAPEGYLVKKLLSDPQATPPAFQIKLPGAARPKGITQITPQMKARLHAQYPDEPRFFPDEDSSDEN